MKRIGFLTAISFICIFYIYTQGIGQYHQSYLDVNGLTRHQTLYVPERHDGGESWSKVAGLIYIINDFYYKTIYSSSSTVNQFMVVGDLHHSSPSSDLSQSMLYELTLAAIKEEVDFVFFTGDLGLKVFESPSVEDSVLKDWRFALDTLLDHNIRVYACRGNVDTGGREVWDSLFLGIYSFPMNGPEMEKNLTYAIVYDNLLFVSLDQYTDAHKINQLWLDSLLSTTTREHIFAAGHEPAFKLLNPNCMDKFPEERNRFWESLTDAGAKVYFSGHDHFYDHVIMVDGDSNPDNDLHQVIAGTGGGSIFSDSEYNGDNGRWTPERQFHEGEFGYVLVELNGAEVEMTWKHRISQNIFDDGGDSYIFTTGTTSLRETQQRNEFLLNYPNPFHSSTTISYRLQVTGNVELSIFDLSGRKAATLVDEVKPADKYEVEWDAQGMQPGIYFCEMRTGQRRQVMKMILIK